MTMLKLAWKNILHKPLNALLSWTGISISAGIISMLLIFQNNFERQFGKNIDGIDMVIGAKGSPLQLILSSVFHIDAPTGNIPLKEAEQWMQHPLVEKAVPLAYGDSYEGCSIIGTTEAYLQHYEAVIAAGKAFENNFEVVLGHNLSQKLSLKVGDTFFSTHGHDEHGEEHTDQAYTVTGVLSPTGTVLDNLIVGNIESVWKIHDHPDEHQHCNHEDGHHHHEDKHRELTAILVKFKTPMALVQMPRLINQETSMMAAVPAIEVNRLFSLFGTGITVLKNIGFGIMLLAALIIFVSLYNALKERKYELALMRTVGISGLRIFISLLAEGLIISITGICSGLVLSRIILFLLSGAIQDNYHLAWDKLWSPVPGEPALTVITLCLGLLAVLIPALRIWSLNISKTLANG